MVLITIAVNVLLAMLQGLSCMFTLWHHPQTRKMLFKNFPLELKMVNILNQCIHHTLTHMLHIKYFSEL